jgi:hypothetical protein
VQAQSQAQAQAQAQAHGLVQAQACSGEATH